MMHLLGCSTNLGNEAIQHDVSWPGPPICSQCTRGLQRKAISGSVVSILQLCLPCGGLCSSGIQLCWVIPIRSPRSYHHAVEALPSYSGNAHYSGCKLLLGAKCPHFVKFLLGSLRLKPWHIVASTVAQEELIACLETLRGKEHRGGGIPKMMMFMTVWPDAWFMLYALLWICSSGIWHRPVRTWRAFCQQVVKTQVVESQLAKKCLVACIPLLHQPPRFCNCV